MIHPKHKIGDFVRASFFLSGKVTGIVWGPDKHWAYADYYYLVDSPQYAPHWVRQGELADDKYFHPNEKN